MFCKNAMYLHKIYNKDNYDKRFYNYNQLLKKFNLEQIKRKLETKEIIILNCGNCNFCVALKKAKYAKKLKAAYQQTKYAYLITITHNDNNIDTILNVEQKKEFLEQNKNYSSVSTINKNKIATIIKN